MTSTFVVACPASPTAATAVFVQDFAAKPWAIIINKGRRSFPPHQPRCPPRTNYPLCLPKLPHRSGKTRQEMTRMIPDPTLTAIRCVQRVDRLSGWELALTIRA